MNMSSSRRRPGPTLVAALLGAAALVIVFYVRPFPAQEDKNLLASDAAVRVEQGPAGLAFLPTGAAKGVGLIVYGGARVPPEAYAYLARACAEAGYTSVLAAIPLNFAVLSPAIAAKAIKAYPDVTRWALAGHSLGGAAAASYAAKGDPAVAGLFLMASSPGKDVDLSTKSLAVVSVSASRDALAMPATIGAARARLPAGCRFVEIAGGNHAQFGEYGPQQGDGTAEIPGPTQRRAVIEEALGLLGRIEAEGGAGK
jgi:Lysophospholipase